MPAALDLLTGITLVGIYSLSILGVYAHLRSINWQLAASVALSVPLAQATFSVIFQIRFLAESPLVGIIGSSGFLIWSLLAISRNRASLRSDCSSMLKIAKKHVAISLPLTFCLIYTLAQAMLLPQTNIDAQTYHFPRVWLFIQSNTFFLDNFTRYHEVIFPVGSDILFYPFLALQATAGLAIFSLSSYIAIGAGVYSIARALTSQRNAAICALVMMSLSEVALQAASVKNDILMAGVAIAALLVTIRADHNTGYRKLLLLLCLCVFGMSTKTTFGAFLPGLFILTIWNVKLWKPATILRLIREARKDTKLTLALIIPLLVCSQIWLYSWNQKHYTGWSGPESFTHRHTQNDGFKGFSANVTRYSVHSLEIGFITNRIVSPSLGLPSLSETLTLWYTALLEPYFENAGSERGAFYTDSLTQEDYSWFGPFGAALLFVCLPIALLRNSSVRLWLLPALLYYLIIAACVSWMIWNGRFMTTFFIALTPALAITLEQHSRPWLRTTLIAIAIGSLAVVKTTDFNRPLLAVGKMASRNIELSASSIIDYSFKQGENIWIKAAQGKRPNPGNPDDLLKSVPQGSEVALVGFGHLGHINFYRARPDIHWIPLNGNPATGEVETEKALNRFMRSSLKYCVVIGDFPKTIPHRLATHCADGYGHLIIKKK